MTTNRQQKGDGMMGAEDSDRTSTKRDASADRTPGSERDGTRNTERTATGDRANVGTQVDQRDASSVEQVSERVGRESSASEEGIGLHDDASTRTERKSQEP